MSVQTEYSPVMSRQYLNVNFIPTAMFSRNTEGLCGFMDDDDTNDLIGPSGERYNDTIQFAESCKYARSASSVCLLNCLTKYTFTLNCVASCTKNATI